MFYPGILSRALTLENMNSLIPTGDYFNFSILGNILEFHCFCSNDQELVEILSQKSL